jgi:hypothetical protein
MQLEQQQSYRLFSSSIRSDEKRNDDLILKLKKDIKENCEMLTEYSSDTPIIAGMKARLDKSDQGIEFHFKKSL